MLALSLVVITVFIGGVGSVSAADIEIRAVRQNRDVMVSNSGRLAAKLIALVESCSVNSTAYAVSSDTWAGIAASDSFVHVAFSQPRRLRLIDNNNQIREQQMIREILLPLPEGRWPLHIFVRSEKDTLSFTKDDPLVFRDVVLERDLQLLKVQPYKFLLDMPKKQ